MMIYDDLETCCICCVSCIIGWIKQRQVILLRRHGRSPYCKGDNSHFDWFAQVVQCLGDLFYWALNFSSTSRWDDGFELWKLRFGKASKTCLEQAGDFFSSHSLLPSPHPWQAVEHGRPHVLVSWTCPLFAWFHMAHTLINLTCLKIGLGAFTWLALSQT